MSFIQSIKDYFARVREYYLESRLSKEEGANNSVSPNHLQRDSKTTKELPSSNDNHSCYRDCNDNKIIDVEVEVKDVKRLK